MQWSEVVLDLHRDERLGVLVELDVGDGSDRLAAHPHLVAGNELPGVLEDGADPVGLALTERGEGDQRHGGDQRRHRKHPRDGGSAFALSRSR